MKECCVTHTVQFAHILSFALTGLTGAGLLFYYFKEKSKYFDEGSSGSLT